MFQGCSIFWKTIDLDTRLGKCTASYCFVMAADARCLCLPMGLKIKLGMSRITITDPLDSTEVAPYWWEMDVFLGRDSHNCVLSK